MSLYNTTHLNTLLQLWEQTNFFADQSRRFYNIWKKIGGGPKELGKGLPIIGSELNLYGELGASISNYGDLRKSLEGRVNQHPTNFLPRIPKESRGIYEHPLDLINSIADSIIQIPEFLLRWNKIRKACIIDDSIPIPLIDLRKENWLNKMPFESFYLRVSSPLVFTSQLYKEEIDIQNFLIHEEGDYIKILAWNEHLEKHIASEEEKKERKKKVDILQSNKNINQFLRYMDPIIKKGTFAQVYSMAIKKNSTFCRTTVGNDITELLEGETTTDVDLYHIPEEVTQNVLSHQRIKFYELINGFCKLMATLPPQIHDKVEVIETIKAPEKPRDKTIWTELPLSYVHTFVTERKDKVVIIRRGIGGEVGFHYRQGHTRRYLLKDGTILDRWFATTKVRADKEAAQGGIPVGGAKKIIT